MSVWLNPITIGFGIACAAVLGLTVATWRKHRQIDAFLMGAVLLLLWGVSKISIVEVGYWQTMQVAPLTNALAVTLCMIAWVHKPRWWTLILGLLLETRAFVHVYFWTVHSPTDAQTFSYLLTLNVLFALELCCVASPGGHVVADMVGARLSRFRGRSDHGLRAPG